MCLMALFAGMVYWLLAPFLPRFLAQKGIDKQWLGIFMSLFAVSFLITALITGKCLLRYMSRVNGVLIAAVLIIINLSGVGLLSFVQDNFYIKALGIVFHICGGIGKGMNHASAMAIVSSYKENKMVYIGYFEACLGLSAFFGPLLGSALYYVFGFGGPFFGIAAL